jgi:hypothetical protein
MNDLNTLELETTEADLCADLDDLTDEQLAMVGGGQGMTVL